MGSNISREDVMWILRNIGFSVQWHEKYVDGTYSGVSAYKIRVGAFFVNAGRFVIPCDEFYHVLMDLQRKAPRIFRQDAREVLSRVIAEIDSHKSAF